MPTTVKTPAAKKPAATRAPRTARAPQDRKPKAAPIVLPEQTPGWDLLVPFSTIPVWDQAELYAALLDVIEGEEDEEDDGGTLGHLQFIGRISKAMLPFAVDEAQFLSFVSGAQGMTNAAPLVMAWVKQLGEIAPPAS